MNPLLVISERDNVATALEPIDSGRSIRVGAIAVTAAESIPRGHKIAIAPIRAGDIVVKYGSAIGVACADIPAGSHVHTHNVASARGRGDLARADREAAAVADAARLAEPPDRDVSSR